MTTPHRPRPRRSPTPASARLGELPADLVRNARRQPDGAQWLAGLQGRVDRYLRRWKLQPDAGAAPAPGRIFYAGQTSIVLPVLGPRGAPLALKLSMPEAEPREESDALRLWNGGGAVRLLDADDHTLLLERLDPDRDLGALELTEAAAVWGSLVRRLSIPPAPGWPAFDHTAAIAEQFNDSLPADWEDLGRPCSVQLLEKALEFCQLHGTVGRHHGTDVLVHADLHYFNVLARPDDGDEFVAIDPKPVVGDAEFGVLPMLQNRLQDLPAGDAAEGMRRRCRLLTGEAGLDPELAAGWSITRAVGDALWFTRQGLHRDAERSLWVALALAADADPFLAVELDRLPHPHFLQPLL